MYIHDNSLQQKCRESKAAWRKWSKAGRSTSGDGYTNMKNTRQSVKQHVTSCRARHERKRLQQRDSMLRNNDSGCFRVPIKQTTCHKLQAGGVTVTHPDNLLKVWVSHFESLAQSEANSHPIVKEQESELPHLESRSHLYEDFTFDTDITMEEVATAVKCLKPGKSGGADNLDPEHLKHGGYTLHVWLLRIFTATLRLESIPPSLKLGVIIPVYKGKGHNPLDPKSYRGITLTSVISKCLEKTMLQRMDIPLTEAGFPHSSQTAYQSSVSCSDAIFSTQEALLKFVREGDDTYLCLYDLEKAFGSIEFPTLLSHLFKYGINGKCWRLIRSWYTNPESVVKHAGTLSHPFRINRGVRQGSVLSPTLFLIVMDSLLRCLHASELGLSINGLTINSAAHADDIRSVSNSITDLQKQGEIIEQFTKDNALKLNVAKTEVIKVSANVFSSEQVQITGQLISTQPTAKCLGYWWHTNLSPAKAIEENIGKSRKAFFALGSIGAYQGALNPLSGRSLFSTFALPILLYGCENWILTDSLVATLEKFQAEIGRCILRLSKFHSELCVIIALRWPRIRVCILLRKLSFLVKLLQSTNGKLSSCVFHTLATEGVSKISLIEQCQQLESEFGTSFLAKCLNNPGNADSIIHEAKKVLISRDWDIVLDRAKCRQSSKHISDPRIAASWCRFWDLALDQGVRGTHLFQNLFRIMCRPLFGERECFICKNTIHPGSTFFEHVCADHCGDELSVDDVIDTIESGDHINISTIATSFSNLF